MNRILSTLIIPLSLLLAACAAQPSPQTGVATGTEPTQASTTATTAQPAGENADAVVAPQGFPVTIQDRAGVELTFDAPPQRVICLINQCVEELAFLGIKPLAVGEFWNYNIALNPQNFGEEAKTIIQVPGREETDWEKVAELEPDLVIAWGEEARTALTGIAPMYDLNGEDNSLDDFVYNVRTLARVFGIEAQTQAKISAALDRLNAYAQRSPKDKTLFITGIDEGPTFYAYSTTDWWPCNLINQFAICGYPEGEGGNISVEGLLNIDPDVIVIEEYDPANGVDAAKVQAIEASDPLWQELSAYKNGTIFVIPRTQARITSIQSLGFVLDTLMPLVYPEVFPQALTDEQVQEILGKTASANTGFPLTITDMGTVGAARMLDLLLPLLYPKVFPASLTEAEVQEILAQ
jgi:iron complex transport system substrate-binding protein